MTARSKARKRALDVLYESELRGTDPVETLRERSAQADPPIGAYASAVIEGVQLHRARIDELIDSYAQGWDLGRLPAVDRNILRIAIFEVLGSDEVPDAVAVDEAIGLASTLSTDDSPRFVNGMLAKIMSDRPTLSTPGSGDFSCKNVPDPDPKTQETSPDRGGLAGGAGPLVDPVASGTVADDDAPGGQGP